MTQLKPLPMKLLQSTRLHNKAIYQMSYSKLILASPQWFIKSGKLYKQFLESNPELGNFCSLVFIGNSPHCSSKELVFLNWVSPSKCCTNLFSLMPSFRIWNQYLGARQMYVKPILTSYWCIRFAK